MRFARYISAWTLAFFAFVLVWVALRICGLSFVATAIILTPPMVYVAWRIPDALE